jgi:hypothetical protein
MPGKETLAAVEMEWDAGVVESGVAARSTGMWLWFAGGGKDISLLDSKATELVLRWKEAR